MRDVCDYEVMFFKGMGEWENLQDAHAERETACTQTLYKRRRSNSGLVSKLALNSIKQMVCTNKLT